MLTDIPGYLSYKYEPIQTLILIYCLQQPNSPNSFHLFTYFSSLSNKGLIQTQFLFIAIHRQMKEIFNPYGMEFVVLCLSADRHRSSYNHLRLVLPGMQISHETSKNKIHTNSLEIIGRHKPLGFAIDTSMNS